MDKDHFFLAAEVFFVDFLVGAFFAVVFFAVVFFAVFLGAAFFAGVFFPAGDVFFGGADFFRGAGFFVSPPNPKSSDIFFMMGTPPRSAQVNVRRLMNL